MRVTPQGGPQKWGQRHVSRSLPLKHTTEHGAFCLSCTKGKAFGERPFALHRQQPEKDKVNVQVTLCENLCGRPYLLCILECPLSVLYEILNLKPLGVQGPDPLHFAPAMIVTKHDDRREQVGTLHLW